MKTEVSLLIIQIIEKSFNDDLLDDFYQNYSDILFDLLNETMLNAPKNIQKRWIESKFNSKDFSLIKNDIKIKSNVDDYFWVQPIIQFACYLSNKYQISLIESLHRILNRHLFIHIAVRHYYFLDFDINYDNVIEKYIDLENERECDD